jgi:protein SCO1/2
MNAVRLKRLFLLGLLGLFACGQPQAPKPSFKGTDITGAEFGRFLNLPDHHGRPRSLDEFRGKAVVAFFGYTHCPDVCPVTLAEMAGAMKLLGEDARRVQVIFVTLDPERDTPELLQRYVTGFDASFLALRGERLATEAAAREFKVFHRRQPGTDGYTIDHTAASYLFDPQGRLRVYAAYASGPEAIAHDIRLLLR